MVCGVFDPGDVVALDQLLNMFIVELTVFSGAVF